jgi:ABC-type Fe3+-hydroxamate transport system substrate-binding protein
VKRRQLFEAAFALAFTSPLLGCRKSTLRKPKNGIVSLAPAITETLFAIGAGPRVIAVSDYCNSPKAAQVLPRVGTSITPNYEAIARLSPSLIVGEANASTRRRELEVLAPTALLPWLSLEDVASSIKKLGELSAEREQANELSARLLARLAVPEPASGPEVLLILGGEGAEAEIWFVRRNSLHGAALRAAGAKNAIAEDIDGPPQLSHERLLSLDPAAILVLARPGPQRSALGGFERFPTLKAVKGGKVAVLRSEDAFANGPRILNLVDQMHAELVRLGVLP